MISRSEGNHRDTESTETKGVEFLCIKPVPFFVFLQNFHNKSVEWKRMRRNQHMFLAVAVVKKAFLKSRLKRSDRLPNPLIPFNLPDPPSLFVSLEFT